MFRDDPAGNRQAQAGAALLGGKVRQKQFVLVFGGNAVTGVSDFAISTASLWRSRRVETERRRTVAPSIASAALSIKFTSTRRSSSLSALIGGKPGVRLLVIANAIEASLK